MVSDMGRLVALLGLVAWSAFAASDQDAIQNTFVKPWIEALRSNDKARIERFIHPSVRACMNDPSTKEFWDYVMQQEHSVPAGAYQVTKIARMQQPAPTFMPEDDMKYPVQPTYEVDIDFAQNNVIFIQFLAPSNGSWYDVLPCPNQKGMALFHQKQVEGAEQKKKVAQLVAELKDPLRSQLNDLLRQQKKMDAIKKYEAAAGVDLTIAVMVIDELQRLGR
jgi:hypothetical protein